MTARAARPRVEWRDVNGILLLDKPVGLSSNAALQEARRLYRARKAGHTGSLDPLASGVLPLCFGHATKIAGLLLEADKTYVATLALGTRTATGDAEGEVVERAPVPPLEAAAVAAACQAFVGPRQQVPPMYSALKYAGRPLYALARLGLEIERAPRPIVIHALALLRLAPASIEFEVCCSTGTYVRTLGEELAGALGSCGHLTALRRTSVAAFAGRPLHRLAELAALGEQARDALLVPADAALADWPATVLDAQGVAHVRHGRAAGCPPAPAGRARIYGPGGELIGLGVVDPSGVRVAPTRLLSNLP
jgi:tRNA pseudouridine55 synthase